MLGDNGVITRQLVGDFQWQRYPLPFDNVIREIDLFFGTTTASGNDTLMGGQGQDILHGQLGDDLLQGGADDDELHGDLGDNTLFGDDGNDILIANVGFVMREFDDNGLPRIDANGSWHRNVILEDIGTITGVMNISSTITTDEQTLLASQILMADLVIGVGAFHPDGTKILSDNGAWDTKLLFIDLTDVHHNSLDGGKGDDVLFGHRGDDALMGGDGNDLIFGDQASNIVPFQTEIPHIFNSLRLMDNDTETNLGIQLDETGSAIVNPISLLPDGLNHNSPFVFAASFGAILPNVFQDFVDAANIAPLTQSDGTQLHPYLSLVPDIVNHVDILSGNDAIDGGDGNDIIFGDKGTSIPN